jgi:predicted transcriptional regulator
MTEHKTGSFEDFKKFTLAVVRGERKVDPAAPKIWVERTEGTDTEIHFQSMEAGAKLLSGKNRALLRVIAERNPSSVAELAMMTGRTEQNLMRTLRKLCVAGIVRLDRGEGRAYRPVVAARKVYFEIDLLAS